MKTAPMWYNEQAGRSDMGWNVELSEHEFMDFVRAVQLDAMKEGMRRAAKIKSYPSDDDLVCSERNGISKAILTAAEQLTEKDLV